MSVEYSAEAARGGACHVASSRPAGRYGAGASTPPLAERDVFSTGLATGESLVAVTSPTSRHHRMWSCDRVLTADDVSAWYVTTFACFR